MTEQLSDNSGRESLEELGRLAIRFSYLDLFKGKMHQISSYSDFQEGARNASLSAECPYRPGTEGTVLRVNGEDHVRRRKVMGKLFRRGGHQWFRDNCLIPTAEASMRELLSHPDSDGKSRVDLLKWARRINYQLTAALVGLDYGREPEGANLLGELMEGVSMAAGAAEADALERPGGRRYEIFVEKFYRPSHSRRRALLEQLEAGTIQESDLPADLIMSIVRLEDPSWADESLAIREAIFLTPAAVMTTARATVWTLAELFNWFDQHPEDRQKRFDSAFLKAAASEAIRLHPVIPVLPPRIATAPVELGSGARIPQGDLALFIVGPGNMETEVFGPDAAEFNPYREIKQGVQPYGTGFGMGPHMCYGLPLVMGATGIDGNLVFLLKLLFKAGIQRDLANPPPPIHLARGRMAIDYEAGGYPVMFDPLTTAPGAVHDAGTVA
jgi:cytochrome P450